jgi:hypothetical protein
MKNYIQIIRNLANQINSIYNKLSDEEIEYDLKNPKVITGKLFSEFNNQRPIGELKDAEFQVFSQWGDDGIIQYLTRNLEIPNKTFIEFGVENYTESNTRFLLINNNWSGFVLDGAEANIKYIKKDPISWAHEIHSQAAFITKENINSLMKGFIDLGYDREIGLLSIDIDGNDYWIWKELNVLSPVIVIVEYNSLWGADKSWTIPYSPDFYRLGEGNSILNYGVSLLSLCDLAEEKGYFFVGCNSAGNNAYFIRKDRINKLKPMSAVEGYVSSKFREMKLPDGTIVSGQERLQTLKGRKVFNTRTQQTEII